MSKNTRKHVFRKGDKIACLSKRCVMGCDYEYNNSTAAKDLLKECGIVAPFKKDLHSMYKKIFYGHAHFEDIRDKMRDLQKAITSSRDRARMASDKKMDSLFGEIDEDNPPPANYYDEYKVPELKIMDSIRQKLVRDFVRYKIQKETCGKRLERKLFFADLAMSIQEPFEVIDKYVKYTGTYDPGYHYIGYDDGDYEPPALKHRTAHVILVTYAERSIREQLRELYKNTTNNVYCVHLLAADCVPYESIDLKDRLKGAPVQPQ